MGRVLRVGGRDKLSTEIPGNSSAQFVFNKKHQSHATRASLERRPIEEVGASQESAQTSLQWHLLLMARGGG